MTALWTHSNRAVQIRVDLELADKKSWSPLSISKDLYATVQNMVQETERPSYQTKHVLGCFAENISLSAPKCGFGPNSLLLSPALLSLFAMLRESATWAGLDEESTGMEGEVPPSGTWGQTHIWGTRFQH